MLGENQSGNKVKIYVCIMHLHTPVGSRQSFPLHLPICNWWPY